MYPLAPPKNVVAAIDTILRAAGRERPSSQDTWDWLATFATERAAVLNGGSQHGKGVFSFVSRSPTREFTGGTGTSPVSPSRTMTSPVVDGTVDLPVGLLKSGGGR
eukprot:Hpha_TRINITY_DN4304_c0_g2::TRINITY_DN4304_c0_g2_i1::g.50039::m.50039